MRFWVSAVTPPWPLRARETEATDTLAILATSLMVTLTVSHPFPCPEGLMARNVNVFMGSCKAFENKGLLQCTSKPDVTRYHFVTLVKNPFGVSGLSGT